jgi:hypothetical protein
MNKFLVSIILSLISINSFAQTRTVMYITSSPGGLYDLMSRGIANYLNNNGFPNIVENVTGAGGMIALNKFSKTEEKSLIVAGGDTISINVINNQIKIDQFVPVAFPAYSVAYFVVSPYNNLTCDNLRSRPLNVGTAGRNSSADIATRILQQHIPNMQIIYYRGQRDALRDVMSDNIDGAIVGYNSLNLLPLFNLSDHMVDNVPGINSCLGINENYQYDFFVFANTKFTQQENERLNQLILQYTESENFKSLSDKLHIVKNTQYDLINSKFQFSLALNKYRRLSNTINFRIE